MVVAGEILLHAIPWQCYRTLRTAFSRCTAPVRIMVWLLNLTTTVSQNRHDSITSSSGRPDTTLIDLLVKSGRNASCQPPVASIHRFALEPTGLSIEITGPARSDARMLIRSNYALIPALLGTTRATI